jgi:hypothetical protein
VTEDLQRSVNELAFLLVGLLPEDRHRILVKAFARALVDRPDLMEGEDGVSPIIATYVGAIIEQVHELEHIRRDGPLC